MRSKTLSTLLAGLLIGLGIGGLLLTTTISERSLFELKKLWQPGFSNAAPSVGAQAPDFSLRSLDGSRVRLREFLGQPVLINFWATWCGPCRLEMPILQSRYERHQSEMTMLAVNFDEPEREVRAFVQQLGLSFPVLMDPGGEVNQKIYQVRGYPTTVIVDANGVVQAIHIGALTDSQIDTYLAEVGLVP